MTQTIDQAAAAFCKWVSDRELSWKEAEKAYPYLINGQFNVLDVIETAERRGDKTLRALCARLRQHIASENLSTKPRGKPHRPKAKPRTERPRSQERSSERRGQQHTRQNTQHESKRQEQRTHWDDHFEDTANQHRRKPRPRAQPRRKKKPPPKKINWTKFARQAVVASIILCAGLGFNTFVLNAPTDRQEAGVTPPSETLRPRLRPKEQWPKPPQPEITLTRQEKKEMLREHLRDLPRNRYNQIKIAAWIFDNGTKDKDFPWHSRWVPSTLVHQLGALTHINHGQDAKAFYESFVQSANAQVSERLRTWDYGLYLQGELGLSDQKIVDFRRALFRNWSSYKDLGRFTLPDGRTAAFDRKPGLSKSDPTVCRTLRIYANSTPSNVSIRVCNLNRPGQERDPNRVHMLMENESYADLVRLKPAREAADKKRRAEAEARAAEYAARRALEEAEKEKERKRMEEFDRQNDIGNQTAESWQAKPTPVRPSRQHLKKPDILVSVNNIVYRQKRNQHGVVLNWVSTPRGLPTGLIVQGTVYLGNGCDTKHDLYGEGSWTLEKHGLQVLFEDRAILFYEQEPLHVPPSCDRT